MLALPILNQIFLLTSTLSFINIEPNNYYYLHGTNAVLDDGYDGHEIFTLFPHLIIDLLSDYYVSEVFFQFEEEQGIKDDISARCYGVTPYSEDIQECESDDMVGRTILITCDCSTRFIAVRTAFRFDVAYINVTGREMFTAFYAGCYESYLTGGSYLVVDLSKCIFDCFRQGYSLAGVKVHFHYEMRYCYCFNGFTGTIVIYTYCLDVECLELQFCGGEDHIMLYYTDYPSFIEQRTNLIPDCIFYGKHCKVCPAGRIGFNCDIIGATDDISARCSGVTPYSEDVQECESNDMVGSTILITCKCPTRFIVVKTEVRFDVAYIKVTGREMFSAFYAGCYESYLTGGGYLVEDLSECIFVCFRQGYSLAGVKMRHCYCFNGFTGTIVINTYCIDVECLESQFCGGEDHIMLYYTDHSSFIEQRIKLTSPDCIFYEEHCKVCPAGRIGFNCDIIDCSNANGNCGDKECFQFDADQRIGGVCRCPPGFELSDRWKCSDIDECDREISECSGSSICKNTIATYICTCLIGYSKVEDNCEDIDECASGLSVCGDDRTCNNTLGTYICVCRIGYSYDESVCKDIDECLEGLAICGDNKHCINSDGSYFCDCAEGFAEEDDECIELSNISFRDKRITRILSPSYLTALALITIPITAFIFVYKVCKRKATESGSRTSPQIFER